MIQNVQIKQEPNSLVIIRGTYFTETILDQRAPAVKAMLDEINKCCTAIVGKRIRNININIGPGMSSCVHVITINKEPMEPEHIDATCDDCVSYNHDRNKCEKYIHNAFASEPACPQFKSRHE